MIARSLNAAGIARLRRYLKEARAGSVADPPSSMLEDPRLTSDLSVEIALEPRAFETRFEAGTYLLEAFSRLPVGEVDFDAGLWAWLSLLWFDTLCPRRADATRRPGADQRHVAEFSSRSRYRHLLYGPYLVVRRHGAVAKVLLSGPPHLDSGIYGSITGVQDLIANRGVVEAASLLYLDPATARLKRGCQPAQAAPGTVRRLVRVVQQLDMTYDVYGMTGEQILELLPGEFDAWRPAEMFVGKEAPEALIED